MSKSPVMLALSGATTLTQDASERARLIAEGTHLAELRDSLLPFEAAAKNEIEAKIEATRVKIQTLDASAAVGNLPMLDPSVFAWTKKQEGWEKAFGKQMISVPSLAYIPIAADQCRLWVNHRGEVRINNTERHSGRLPAAVEGHYAETMTALSRKHLSWEGRESLTLTYTYPGIVPQEIKDLVKEEAEKKRFDRLAFVCDVDHWKVGITPAPTRIYLDPILVGEKANALWVIASFDPTPIEQYVSSEFTS